MPSAALRRCSGGCGALVRAGRCPLCARKVEQRRGNSAERGYGSEWRRFRQRFINLLIDAHIVPVCGAALPDGPKTQDSLCKQEGLLNGDRLHLDHEPPLTEAERQDMRAVCDPTRIQLLCGPRCHHDKSVRQQQAGGCQSI